MTDQERKVELVAELRALKLPHAAWKPIIELVDLLLTSEKRASEAERTFADLRNLIAVNLAANAELVRERDDLQMAYDGVKRNRDLAIRQSSELRATAEHERDEARAGLGKVVEALKIARTYVELSYDETDGEEACEAKHALSVVDAALRRRESNGMRSASTS